MIIPGLDAAAIKRQAHVLGFDLCGIAPAVGLPDLASYQEWVARGYAGTIWWKAVMIENQGWMAVGNVGTRVLSY